MKQSFIDSYLPKCEICGSEERVFVAHYEKHIKHRGRLIAICLRCHSGLHAKRAWLKRKKRRYVLPIELSYEQLMTLKKLQKSFKMGNLQEVIYALIDGRRLKEPPCSGWEFLEWAYEHYKKGDLEKVLKALALRGYRGYA